MEMEKLPLVIQTDAAGQPTKVPTRKWFAGLSSGIAVAVTLAPVIFPQVMTVVEAWAPAFAAEYGERIAITVSAIVSVLGGSGVAWLTKNRATPGQVVAATDAMKEAATEAAIKAVVEAVQRR
jgi:hypothetical protein